MKTNKGCLEHYLSEGVIFRGNAILDMQIKKTRKDVIFWDLKSNKGKGILNHILLFEDYTRLDKDKYTGAALLAGVSLISFYKNHEIESDLRNAILLDEGTVNFTASLLGSHIYTAFNGFKTLSSDNQFKSILSKKSRLQTTVMTTIIRKLMIDRLAGLLIPIKGFLTQDSFRNVFKSS